jgi:hypothetical protein
MTEKEQQRVMKHRLAVIRHADEVTENVGLAPPSGMNSADLGDALLEMERSPGHHTP